MISLERFFIRVPSKDMLNYRLSKPGSIGSVLESIQLEDPQGHTISVLKERDKGNKSRFYFMVRGPKITPTVKLLYYFTAPYHLKEGGTEYKQFKQWYTQVSEFINN